MDSISFEIKGLDEVKKRFSGLEKKMAENIDDVLNVATEDIALEAKQRVPIDEGKLASSISANNSKFLEKSISVNAFYAAFVHFGTGKYAAEYVSSLPDEWRTFASQFKGQKGGGTFKEFVLAMKEYLLRHGASQKDIDQHAYAVAKKILRNGIKPHPFLLEPFEQNKPIIIRNIENVLNGL